MAFGLQAEINVAGTFPPAYPDRYVSGINVVGNNERDVRRPMSIRKGPIPDGSPFQFGLRSLFLLTTVAATVSPSAIISQKSSCVGLRSVSS